MKHKEMVINNQLHFAEQMTGHRADIYPFKALSYLKGYDSREGSMHYDHLASLYYTFAQCVVKADGTVSKAEEELLKDLHKMIHSTPAQDPSPVTSKKEEKIDKKYWIDITKI